MVSKVIIVGTGKIACTSLHFVLRYLKPQQIEVYEYKPSSLSVLHSFAKKSQVRYRELKNNEDAVTAMKGIQESTLVISANNLFLFPKEILQNKYLDVVNYHSALLPKYPGVNAATWAIYNNERVAGITWHCIDSEVDHGDIIIQKECIITDDMTALALNRKQDELATQALEEILPGLLAASYSTKKQVFDNRRIYKSKEIPDEGWIKAKNNTIDSYRVLRSVDYGAFRMFPKMKIEYQGQLYQIEKYIFNRKRCEEQKKVEKSSLGIEIKDMTGELQLTVSPLQLK